MFVWQVLGMCNAIWELSVHQFDGELYLVQVTSYVLSAMNHLVSASTRYDVIMDMLGLMIVAFLLDEDAPFIQLKQMYKESGIRNAAFSGLPMIFQIRVRFSFVHRATIPAVIVPAICIRARMLWVMANQSKATERIHEEYSSVLRIMLEHMLWPIAIQL